jgi:chorismate mutase
MTDKEQRLANARKEIADRVANFKAMQAKFQREREEYCTTTLRNACEGKALSYWR